MTSASDVIVIGAGWSGLSAANSLARAGLSVQVIEKGRGPGGRSATRRQDGFQFDHGAQYFTARSAEFRTALEAWRSAGLVAEWSPRIHVFGDKPAGGGRGSPSARWVGMPGMNGVLSHLASELDCRFGERVHAIDFNGHWQVSLANGQSLSAHSLILTAPPAQAAALLGEAHPLTDELNNVPMKPTWAVMAGFDTSSGSSVDPGFDAAFDNEGPLSWLALNRHKPGRTGGCAWTGHASVGWSQAHLERDAEWVAAELYAALSNRLDVGDRQPDLLSAHRWRYAQCAATINKGCLWHNNQRLAVAGDWCAGNRVEGAWTSGQRAAERVIESLQEK